MIPAFITITEDNIEVVRVILNPSVACFYAPPSLDARQVHERYDEILTWCHDIHLMACRACRERERHD